MVGLRTCLIRWTWTVWDPVKEMKVEDKGMRLTKWTMFIFGHDGPKEAKLALNLPCWPQLAQVWSYLV